MEAATEVCADGWRQIFQKNFSKLAATRDKGKRIEKGKVASAVTPMVEWSLPNQRSAVPITVTCTNANRNTNSDFKLNQLE